MEWFKRRGVTQVYESKTPVFTVSTPSTPELGIDLQTPPTPSRLRSLVGAFRRTRRAHPRAQPQPLPSSLGSIVVATVFGLRVPGARIHLAIQPHPRSPPLAVIELATTTGAFMADIASGPLNFVLQCATRGGTDALPLWEEARWAQFCNGCVSGSARRRGGGDADAVDLRVIEMLEHVSFGAGILPDYFVGTGTGTGTGTGMVDLVYMRALYERVVRSKDAEVLSMLGSEVKGYPEISFNLIRV
ncbi:Protein MIZU-KUSSEI 1 [Ananas comosus]|uniref:Protein MIZU-KUSSEI 1 n=1 Tax=Ananas comosus TaxID=4615 RepID=A0A199W6D2_ANACO|nr:Protein MIZU-KUSSEI 1 [Ananas comosus]